MGESRRDDIAKLETLYAEHPEGRVFTHLAEAYRRAGRLERAREVLEEGLSRHADYASAHVVHGRVLLDEGRAEDASEAFRRVLELDPQNLVALRAVGDIALGAGRMEEAGSAYRRLLVVDPGNQEALAALAAVETGASGAGPDAGAGSAMELGWEAADAGDDEVSPVEGLEATALSDDAETDEEGAAAAASPGWELPEIETTGSGLDEARDGDWMSEAVLEEPEPQEADDYEAAASSDVAEWELPQEGDEDLDAAIWRPEPDSSEDALESTETDEVDFDVSAEVWDPDEDDTDASEAAGAEWETVSGLWDDDEDEEDPGGLAGDTFGLEREPWAPAPDPERDAALESAQGFDDDAGMDLVDEPPTDPAEEPATYLVEEPLADLEEEPDGWAPAEAGYAEAEAETVDPEPIERAADTGAEFPGGELVTETMADLYAQQGLHERAREMYARLLAERPGDGRIEAKLEALDARGAEAPAGDAPAGAANVQGQADVDDATPPDLAAEPGSGQDGAAYVDAGAADDGVDDEETDEVAAAVESYWTGGESVHDAEESPYAWGSEGGGETGEAVAEEEVAGPAIGEYFARLLVWRPSAARTRERGEPGAADGTDRPGAVEAPDERESFEGWVENVDP